MEVADFSRPNWNSQLSLQQLSCSDSYKCCPAQETDMVLFESVIAIPTHVEQLVLAFVGLSWLPREA